MGKLELETETLTLQGKWKRRRGRKHRWRRLRRFLAYYAGVMFLIANFGPLIDILASR